MKWSQSKAHIGGGAGGCSQYRCWVLSYLKRKRVHQKNDFARRKNGPSIVPGTSKCVCRSLCVLLPRRLVPYNFSAYWYYTSVAPIGTIQVQMSMWWRKQWRLRLSWYLPESIGRVQAMAVTDRFSQWIFAVPATLLHHPMKRRPLLFACCDVGIRGSLTDIENHQSLG